MRFEGLLCFPMALRAAVQLKVFDIIAESGPGAQLAASQIVARLPTANPAAAVALERILRLLAAHSLLITAPSSESKLVYGLTEHSLCLLTGADGTSMASLVQLGTDKATVESFYYLKDVVLSGGAPPFDKAHGENLYEYTRKNPGYSEIFNKAMSARSSTAMRMVFEGYTGFDEVKELLDVGGGIGTSISAVVSLYPHIRGRNFDLPRVVASAPPHPGVEQEGGDMFDSVPTTETIFMNSVLHNWDDERCIKLLANCRKALPEVAKMIVVEHLLPQELGIDPVPNHALVLDLLMMVGSPSGKERTFGEYACLAKAAGFNQTKDFAIAKGLHVMEFHKK